MGTADAMLRHTLLFLLLVTAVGWLLSLLRLRCSRFKEPDSLQ
jgi:hypothetical protein